MKNFKSLIILGMTLFVVSCQNGGSDSNNNNGNNTTTPINGDCVNNPSSCQQGVYNQGYGFYPYNNGYPYNYQGGFYYTNNSAYLCNCPAGSMPTYNNYGGLGCVSSNYAYGYGGYAYFGWGAGSYSGASNNQWVNIPQVSNYTGYNQSNGNCYNGVVQSCLVDQASSCSAGYTCRATAAQSRLGLCVSNNAAGNGQYNGGYR